MLKLRITAVLIAAALLLACGQDQSPASGAAPAVENQTLSSLPSEPEAPGDADDQQTAGLGAVEESSEPEEDTADSSPAGISRDIVLAQADPGETSPASGWKYQAGQEFTRFASAQGTSSAPDKVEVAEVFWYGCPHCYNFDPVLNEWKQSLADDVSFVRIPVIWSPTHEFHARAFYTAEALGKLDQIHPAFFRAIHIDNNPLTTEEAVRELFEEFGVSGEEFERSFNSFAVSSKLNRARTLTRNYQVRSVPIMIVNGKYATSSQLRTFDDVLDVVDELVTRERQTL